MAVETEVSSIPRVPQDRDSLRLQAKTFAAIRRHETTASMGNLLHSRLDKYSRSVTAQHASPRGSQHEHCVQVRTSIVRYLLYPKQFATIGTVQAGILFPLGRAIAAGWKVGTGYYIIYNAPLYPQSRGASSHSSLPPGDLEILSICMLSASGHISKLCG